MNVVIDDGENLSAGGDVAGVYQSLNGGEDWQASNGDVADQLQMAVASIAYHPSNSDYMFAAYGLAESSTGGLARSTDGGVTWSVLNNTDFYFSGQGPNVGVPDDSDVRSTGNLIVVDAGNNLLYVGTYRDGVWRYNFTTSVWTSIALDHDTVLCDNADDDCFIRTLIPKPGDLTTLFVGTYGNGIFRIDDANDDAVAAQISASPHAEELAFDLDENPDALYCACGAAGIRKATDAPEYDTWNAVNSGIQTNGPEWDAIVAVPDGDVYVGAQNPALSTVYRPVKRFNGSTWVDIVKTDNVSTTVCDTESTPWWVADVDDGDSLLDGERSDVAMLTELDGHVFAAGRAGIWRYSVSGDDWCPAVSGLGVSAPKDMAVSQVSAELGRVFVAQTDWQFFYSDDYLQTVTRTDVVDGAIAADYGLSVAADSSAYAGDEADVYLGVGGRQSDGPGEVFRTLNPDPTEAEWDSMDLDGQTGVTGDCVSTELEHGRSLGLAVGRENGLGTHIVVVVAVDGCGVWRWESGAGNGWDQVVDPTLENLLGDEGGREKVPVSWPQGSNTVYILDPATQDLWVSFDFGVSWDPVWSEVPGPLGAGVGYVAADEVDETRVWVTAAGEDGTYLISCTDETADIANFTNSAPENPGPVVAVPGSSFAFIATRQVGSDDPGLWLADDVVGDCESSPDATLSGVVVNNPVYERGAVFPSTLAASSESSPKVYVGTAGQGALIVSNVT